MLNRLIDNSRCIYNYIYVQENLGPRKINRSDVSTINAAICWCTMIYNDTWSSWAFRSRRSQPKLISWWRIFVVKLMVPVCSGISQIGQRTHTHRHTHTHWHCGNTHKHTPKKTQNGDQQWSTMINIHHHVLLLLLISPRISSYLLVSPRTLYGRSVWIGLSWSLKANCAEQSLPLLTLLPLSTSTILSQVESISSWTLGILLCQRTMAFWIAYLQKWSKMQILWNGNCRESTVEKAIESAILRSSWNNFLSHSSLSPREPTN